MELLRLYNVTGVLISVTEMMMMMTMMMVMMVIIIMRKNKQINTLRMKMLPSSELVMEHRAQIAVC